MLRRFAAKNVTENPKERTGGYSINRKFWGGLESWAPRIARFASSQVADARSRFKEDADASVPIEIVRELAEMIGEAPSGNRRPLGTVAASKLAFFMCPEMPAFIYDSVAGKARGRRTLPPDAYGDWCKELAPFVPSAESMASLLQPSRLIDFDELMDWLARRSLDLALYEQGR